MPQFLLISRISLILFVFIEFSACIVPPSDLTPSVLPPAELEMVSSVKMAQDAILGAKPELAEERLRKVLRKRKGGVYNDLGFALLAQDRPREAVQYFTLAIKTEEGFVTPWLNLARALYRNNELERAIKQLEALMSWNESVKVSGLVLDAKKFPDKRVLTPQEEGIVYRNMSVIYYTMGFLDESYCFSEQALRIDPDGQLGFHARLLLSLERVAEALPLTQAYVVKTRENASSSILFDYGVSLYVLGKTGLANEAFLKVLARGGLAQEMRLAAKLAHLRLSLLNESEEKVDLAYQTFLDEEPDFCDRGEGLIGSYWPQSFIDDIGSTSVSICKNERKSFF